MWMSDEWRDKQRDACLYFTLSSTLCSMAFVRDQSKHHCFHRFNWHSKYRETSSSNGWETSSNTARGKVERWYVRRLMRELQTLIVHTGEREKSHRNDLCRTMSWNHEFIAEREWETKACTEKIEQVFILIAERNLSVEFSFFEK